jgi:hypothetical protein
MHCANLYSGYLAITKGPGLPSPSVAAKSAQYAKLQANPRTTIYDGFYDINHPADTSALPIEIYHPVFQRFTENITTAEPSKELLNEVQKLMRMSTGVGTVEEPLARDLRSALNKTGKKYSILLLVMEYKRAVGEGECDPLTQASHSTRKHWREGSVSVVGF